LTVRRQRRLRQALVLAQVLAEMAGDGDTATLTIEAVSTREAIALIAALPPEQAEAVQLRVIAGLDSPTAGKLLGKRAGAIRTAAHRGLRRLAERIDPRGTTSPAHMHEQESTPGERSLPQRQ
jgi:RNA polymerase sigma-70 factor, ECF subfamily